MTEKTFKNLYKQTNIYSIQDIIKANENAGKYFFSKHNMRFFNSRILSDLYPSADKFYFVTSEQGPSNVRKYSVRSFDPDTCNIETVGDFGAYDSAYQAKKAAKLTAEKGGAK